MQEMRRDVATAKAQPDTVSALQESGLEEGMSRKSPFVKLSLLPVGMSKRRSPILGGTVVADYEQGGERVVVIECSAAQPKPARKAKAKPQEQVTA